jgi:hypothetical protein
MSQHHCKLNIVEMGKLTDKVKETLKDAKYTVVGEDSGTETSTSAELSTEYESKEPMSPEKIKEHESTAVKRNMEEKITGPGETSTNPEEAAERARRSGITKGTAGAKSYREKS